MKIHNIKTKKKAADKIKNFAEKDGINENVGIQVAVKGGGCSGLSYDLQFTSEEAKDTVFEHDGFKIYMDAKSLKDFSKTLPKSAGVYQFFDSKDNIIYIGKAKNLKKRVASYFSKQSHTGKTRKLISSIYLIKYIVVQTESDALLLENINIIPAKAIRAAENHINLIK